MAEEKVHEYQCALCRQFVVSTVQKEASYEVGSGGPIVEVEYVVCSNCDTRTILSETVIG